MILCDIGNSTFSFFDTQKNIYTKVFLKDLDKVKFQRNQKIFFISVNKNASIKLKQKFSTINIKKYIHLNTKYKNLGIDRKILCTYIKNGIIIDAGSAITLDIMKNKQHLGGTILLGLNSIKHAYPKISNKLQVDFKPFFKDKIPTNTNQAINYAITNMIIQPIKHIIKQHPDLKIYITGGDGKIIYQLLKVEFTNLKYNPNLIFKAMYKCIKNNKI